MLREGDASGAYAVIRSKNCFSAICGRICSAPCEVACILNEDGISSIGIRGLERYASDFGRFKQNKVDRRGKKIAIVGSGPAGLSAAYSLVNLGYQVVVFEAFDKPGGVLRYGVPEFRIPKKILDGQINSLKALGVEIKTNLLVGKALSLEDLFEQEYAAILLATGAAVPKFIDVPGESLAGVFYGEEFLMRVNLTKSNIFSRYVPTFDIGEKIVVVGSGNTALDCSRSAVRFGRDVTLIFRRTEEEMFVRDEERDYGKEEGIKIEPLVRMVEIVGDANNYVTGIKCIRMDYADAGVKGEWILEPVPGSEFVIEADTVVICVGHKPNAHISKLSSGLKLDSNGTISVDDKTSMTSLSGVFAAGNVVTDSHPLIDALSAGMVVAGRIDDYLKKYA